MIISFPDNFYEYSFHFISFFSIKAANILGYMAMTVMIHAPLTVETKNAIYIWEHVLIVELDGWICRAIWVEFHYLFDFLSDLINDDLKITWNIYCLIYITCISVDPIHNKIQFSEFQIQINHSNHWSINLKCHIIVKSIFIKECTVGWYGVKCSQECERHCRDGATCNHVVIVT